LDSPHAVATAATERMSDIRGKTFGTVFQDPVSALTPVYTVGDQIAEAF
jgi:peptide/nickel transport system ATP-binding protein